MGTAKIVDIQQKYDQLSSVQKEIFAGYGLRQIKHFVELSLPDIMQSLPEGAEIQGINQQGRIQAFDQERHLYYVWISDLQWQKSLQYSAVVDTKQDFIEVWKIFQLADYELIDLSHIHRDFLTQN